MKMRVYIPAHPVQTLLFFDRNNAKRSDCYDLGCALLFPQRDSSSYCFDGVLALYSQSPLALVLFDLPLLLLPDTTLLQNHHQNIFTSWTSAFYSNPVLVSVSNDNVNNIMRTDMVRVRARARARARALSLYLCIMYCFTFAHLPTTLFQAALLTAPSNLTVVFWNV